MIIPLRSRRFLNEPFIKIDDQSAPRIGLSRAVHGDGRSKLFFNAGRYHLPIASNTNIRIAGNECFDQQWFALDTSQGNGGLNPDDAPIFLLDAMGNRIPLTGLAVFSDAIPDEPATVLDTTIEPMYQDEYIF